MLFNVYCVLDLHHEKVFEICFCGVVLDTAPPTPIMAGWPQGAGPEECVLLWKWIVIPTLSPFGAASRPV